MFIITNPLGVSITSPAADWCEINCQNPNQSTNLFSRVWVRKDGNLVTETGRSGAGVQPRPWIFVKKKTFIVQQVLYTEIHTKVSKTLINTKSKTGAPWKTGYGKLVKTLINTESYFN